MGTFQLIVLTHLSPRLDAFWRSNSYYTSASFVIKCRLVIFIIQLSVIQITLPAPIALPDFNELTAASGGVRFLNNDEAN
jgi:hypothetical protein